MPWLKPLKIKAGDFHWTQGCPLLVLDPLWCVMTGSINNQCLVPGPGHWATSEYADTVNQNGSQPQSQ